MTVIHKTVMFLSVVAAIFASLLMGADAKADTIRAIIYDSGNNIVYNQENNTVGNNVPNAFNATYTIGDVLFTLNAETNQPGDFLGILNSTTATIKNLAGGAVTYTIEFITEGGYSSPGSNTSTVEASTDFGANAGLLSNPATIVTSAYIGHFFPTTLIDSHTFSGGGAGAATGDSILFTRNGGGYQLRNVLTISAPGNNITVGGTVFTSVSAVPEPWNVVALVATMLPVGLFYFARRQSV